MIVLLHSHQDFRNTNLRQENDISQALSQQTLLSIKPDIKETKRFGATSRFYTVNL